jgi:lincosamide nucleotidyltransferase
MNFANIWLFGANVLARGEVARSLEVLSLLHRYLLWMARLAEGQTTHWATPARGLEREISPAAYARFLACTAPAKPSALRAAYRSAWGRELMEALVPTYGPAIPHGLLEMLSARQKEL